MKIHFFFAVCALVSGAGEFARAADSPPVAEPPVKIIFDTDMGNDVDDVLALSLLHALQTRHRCELLGVTITQPDELAGPFVDAINTFYGRPQIPIGFTRAGLVLGPSKFLWLADAEDDGWPRYPHRLKRSSDALPATHLLRMLLTRQPDHSAVLVQTGFFSNLAALLDTPGDGLSPLGGMELVKLKVRLLSLMAGAFQPIKGHGHFLEFNVMTDIAAAQQVAKAWPTPMVWSGCEIGMAVTFPAVSIERDFAYVPHHPAAEAYYLYRPPPHNRPAWDLTSVLYAVLPERGYFNLSPPGKVTVEADGFTKFEAADNGRDRYLILDVGQVARVREALVQLASEPPAK